MNRNKIVYILDKAIEWFLYALVLSIPFSKSMVEICITLAFIGWVAKKILAKDLKLEKTPLNLLLFAFLAVNLLSFINADFKLLFMRSMVSKCIKFIALYFITVETIDSDIKLKNFLTVALVSAVMVMIDSYLQYYVLHYDFFRFYQSFKYVPSKWPAFEAQKLGYPTGPFPFPNDLSAWMLMILMPVLSLFLWGVGKVKTKFILGSFLFPFSFLFYLANARSAWFGFIVSLFLTLFFQMKKLMAISITAALITVVLSLSFLAPRKADNIFDSSSVKDRFHMWNISWNVFTEHPIIGNGLNMFFRKYMEYRDDGHKGKRGSYAHNGFLQMAADIGIVGLTVFLLLIGKAFRSTFRYIRRVKDPFYNALAVGLAGGISAFLIHSFFDTNLHSLPLVTLFWFGLAVLMSIPNIYPSTKGI